MGMRLEGMSELLNSVSQLGLAIDEQLTNKAVTAGAVYLRDKVKETVPVRTGNLKANIIHSTAKNGKVDVGPDQQGDAFYGHMLEYGTSKMAAQPFMQPSLERNKSQIEKEMADVIRNELRL